MAESSSGSIEGRIVLALRVVAPLVIVGAFLWRMLSGIDPAERFFDDFFYYVKAAQNWVEGAGSTFFPGEPTNGYHPLWFLWLALLYRVTGATDAVFFGLVDVSLMLLLAGFFFLFERFLFRVTQDRLAAVCGAAFAAIRLTMLSGSGVEMALTCLAAALLLERLSHKPMREQSVRDAALIGLLGAFLVLSRLDAVLLAPGLTVLAALRWDVRRIAAAAAGAAPAYAYVAFNLATYGHPFTTSMAAKSLAFYLPPNFHFLLVSQPVLAFVASIVAASVIVVILLRRGENSDARMIALALVSAPLLQIAMQAFISGWMIFEWYFYFAVMMLGLAVALVVQELRRLKILALAGASLGAVALAVASFWIADGMKPNELQREIAELGRKLSKFASAHPGTYAMGDAAGTPGWMVKQPIVHLEGLMMSHDFLDRIRERRPLEETFRDYGVSYYVAVRPERTGASGCLEFAEPNSLQASPRAPAMAMTICEKPVEIIQPGTRYQVRIYRIDPATGRAIAP